MKNLILATMIFLLAACGQGDETAKEQPMSGLSLPISAVNTANLDATGDRPDQARADLLDLAQKVNQILANMSASAVAGNVAVRDGGGALAGDITGNAATATNATNATSATNATNATNASDSTTLGGKKWVNVISGTTSSISASSMSSFNLRAGGGHRLYRVSVYPVSGAATWAYEGYTPINSTAGYYQIGHRSAGNLDQLWIYNCSGGSSTFTYQVDVWE